MLCHFLALGLSNSTFFCVVRDGNHNQTSFQRVAEMTTTAAVTLTAPPRMADDLGSSVVVRSGARSQDFRRRSHQRIAPCSTIP
eukprot:419801-Rhodomonas_salina.1